MLPSLTNHLSIIKSRMSEAFSAESNRITHIFISAIPLIGLAFIHYKEFVASKDLLSAIKGEDNQRCIELINRKNCYKLYRTIHTFAIATLAIPGVGFYYPILLFLVSPLVCMYDFHKAYRVIEPIKLGHHSFVVIPDEPSSAIPRMRVPRLSFLFPWIECAVKNKLSNTVKLHFFTVY